MSTMTTSVVTISPKSALHMIENEMWPDQRPVEHGMVGFLAEAMRRDQFNGGSSIQLAMCPQGKWYVLDGQNRLHAIVKYGAAVAIVVVRHECKSMQEIGEIYSRIDRGRGRSMVDAMRGLGLLRDETELCRTELKHFGQASVLLSADLTSKKISGANYHSRSAEARQEEMQKWRHAAGEYFDATRTATEAKLFDRREVVAIGILTFADAPDAASAFWRAAAADDGLRATDPRKKMLETMRKTPATSAGMGYLSHVVAACWNAYVEGRDLSKVVVRDPRADITLLSTRYAKR